MGNRCADPIERASRLKQEADYLGRRIRLHSILSPYGKAVPTGSYFLDVMVYPDLDLYISRVSIAQLFEIGGQLASSDLVYQVVFERSRSPQLPGGLYLKARIDYGDWGRPWKVDIWSLPDAVIDEKMKDMRRFKKSLSGRLRKQILTYKCSVLTEQNRTPMYSGYFIYKAFIDEGLSDFQQVTDYLVNSGVQMH